jgi:negative regulator of replication initiation
MEIIYKHIVVHEDLYNDIHYLRKPGESWDSVVRRMLKVYKDKVKK